MKFISLEEIDLLFKVEECSYSSFSNCKVGRVPSDMIQFELSVHFLCDIRHHLEVVKTSKTLNYLLEIVSIIKQILAVVIFL